MVSVLSGLINSPLVTSHLAVPKPTPHPSSHHSPHLHHHLLAPPGAGVDPHMAVSCRRGSLTVPSAARLAGRRSSLLVPSPAALHTPTTHPVFTPSPNPLSRDACDARGGPRCSDDKPCGVKMKVRRSASGGDGGIRFESPGVKPCRFDVLKYVASKSGADGNEAGKSSESATKLPVFF